MSPQPELHPLDSYLKEMQPAAEDWLRASVARASVIEPARFEILHHMLAYHMGWEGLGAGPAAQGKRIRPALVLLSAAAAGGTWQAALPAAAAVELVHNFSLIHDDIEDISPLRRGRETIWKIWGVAQAINAGDLMFTLAHMEIMRLGESGTPALALEAARLLQETCLALTQGQYLDIAYETARDFDLEAYWPMVGGKTAALLACSCELGALCAGAAPETRCAFHEFGHSLGLAFQAWDDWLGIWGDSRATGKSTASDLVSGKKSLPVLYGLGQAGEFARRLAGGPVQVEEAPELARLLEMEGAEAYTRQTADRLTTQALKALDSALAPSPAADALRELARRLLDRKV